MLGLPDCAEIVGVAAQLVERRELLDRQILRCYEPESFAVQLVGQLKGFKAGQKRDAFAADLEFDFNG